MEKRFAKQHIKQADKLIEGLNLSQHIACGKIIFNTTIASKLALEGEQIILVKNHLYPEDVETVKLSQGLLLTHRETGIFAMMMSRTLKKSCILASSLSIDEDKKCLIVNNKVYPEGTVVSLDGHTGNVYLGAIQQIHMLGYNDLTRQQLKKKSEKIYYK